MANVFHWKNKITPIYNEQKEKSSHFYFSKVKSGKQKLHRKITEIEFKRLRKPHRNLKFNQDL